MQHQATAFYPQLNSKNGVCVAGGYGIRIYVERGHLVIADGIGRQRRERRFARAGTSLERLVILGHEGFVSLAAFRWLSDVRATFVQIDRDGRIVAASGSYGVQIAQLRRAQALAAYTETGISITRKLLREKISGQLSLSSPTSTRQQISKPMFAARSMALTSHQRWMHS